ncbi:DUF2062 domain-containing protein [Pseudemcibacter aquimaris]|uniref:DUF2062 domain-containing protein n=1 Tax=Pseudemcibacter aquimaris TaxID=2857064 RepID=UPI0020118773|nr:DUF2062 domain-containing protein [Pseudemcibacter aquimaris]
MFRRRKQKTFLEKVREFIWPSAGWRRAGNYMKHRLARIDGTPYAIAAGFASGAAVSFTPFVGLHFIFAAVIAWIVRGNILTSAIGTAVGNPWTFPFIWAGSYNLGINLMGGEATDDLMGQLDLMFSSFTIVDLVNNPIEALGPFLTTVFLPMLLGGALIGASLWFFFYWPIYKLVSEYKINRMKRRQKNKKGM